MKARVLELERKHEVFKQENWDLYVMQQQLEEKLASRSTAQSRAELDRQRLGKELEKLRESLEHQRAQFEENEEALRKLRKQRETEDASSRRERAGFRRNISDLHGQIKRLQSDQPAHVPALPAQIDEEVPETTTSNEHASNERSLRKRLSLQDGDSSQDTSGVIRDALPFNAEADELRSKLSMAIKRLGRDNQQQRKLREQISELRKLLSRAGVSPPVEEASEDGDDDDDEDDAWIMEAAEKPESPKPRRRLRRHAQPRIISRGPSSNAAVMPTSEWLDASFGDDSVIIREPNLDSTTANLLGDMPNASAENLKPFVGATAGDLGSELDAEGYSTKPDMLDVKDRKSVV